MIGAGPRTPSPAPPPAGGQSKKAPASTAGLPLVCDSERPVAESNPPCSNTGVNQCAALVDYLAVSIALASFRDSTGPEQFLLPKNENDLGAAIGSFRFRNLAQTYFNQAFPNTAIEARPFDKKGFLGYVYSSSLHVQGVEGQVGMMGVGGNGNTVHISLTGAGCAWLRNWLQLRLSLEGLGATVTRCDLAMDDLEGEFLDVHALAAAARGGMFDRKGKPANRRFVDDLGTGKGSTLYVGAKGAKELCIYEKGKQLGSPASSWVRAEVRLWSKNRVIPFDALTIPADYIRGEYPALAPFLPPGGASRAKVAHAQAEATIEAAERWVTHAAGKTLDFLRRAAERADLHPSEVINALSREGTPKRFAGMPEEVCFKRAESRFGQASSVFDMPEVEYGESIRLYDEFHREHA